MMTHIEPEAPDWTTMEFASESWRAPEVTWDLGELVDVAVAASTSSTICEFAGHLFEVVLTSATLRASEVVLVGADGGLHHGCGSSDAGLLAWAVSRVWNANAAAGGLLDGVTRAEAWASPSGGDAIACVPLAQADDLKAVIAVWLASDDMDTTLQCIARLTLAQRLWSSVPATIVESCRDGLSSPTFDELTPRQSEIVHAMSLGRTNRQIARQIAFSESTVRLESMAIYRHFGVHSREDAVIAARESGLL
jgi:DNA-binding CsgD family transcriptional regulator